MKGKDLALRMCVRLSYPIISEGWAETSQTKSCGEKIFLAEKILGNKGKPSVVKNQKRKLHEMRLVKPRMCSLDNVRSMQSKEKPLNDLGRAVTTQIITTVWSLT